MLESSSLAISCSLVSHAEMICSCTVFVKLCVSFLAHHWDEEFMPQNAPKAHPTDPTGHGSLSQGPARAVRAPTCWHVAVGTLSWSWWMAEIWEQFRQQPWLQIWLDGKVVIWNLFFLNVVVSPLFDFDGFLFWERIGTNYSMNMDELGRLPSGKLT